MSALAAPIPIAPEPWGPALLSALTTPLGLLLLGLVILNGAGLLRPERLLSRAVGAALLLPLLLLLALPLPGTALALLLRIAIPLLVALLVALLRRPPAAAARPGYLATAVLSSAAIGLLFALRPHPFEYPGDATDYLQGFIQAQLEPAPLRSCLVEGLRQPTYQRFCTLWSVILQLGHLEPQTLLSGMPQRLTLALEVSVLGLSLFRLLQAAGVGAAAAALSWLLVAFGLGNQAIAFLVNHGLQGSILAAAVFLEAVMVLLRLLCWRGPPLLQAGSVMAALLLFLLLTMKLHGAFALCTLALIVPLLALIAVVRLSGRWQGQVAMAQLSAATARWLLLASLAVLVVVLSLKTGWLINKQARTIVSWGFLGWLGVPPQALPASYLMRAPGSRPETLAVAAIVIGLTQLIRGWGAGGDRRATSNRSLDPAGDRATETALYGLVASLYGLSVLVAFLLPPFSHLFVNLPYEVISNYRLMWGCSLFSPRPCLLERALAGRGPGVMALGAGERRWAVAVATAIAAVVLVPVPAGPGRQLFWSKSRHILQGPPRRVDLQATAAALVPALVEAAPPGASPPPVVLADEQIASALAPWTTLLRPTHPIRVYNRANLSDPRLWDTQAPLRVATTSAVRVRALVDLESRPVLAVQQVPFDAAAGYSPYSEIGVYDRDIVTQVSATSVNALTPGELEAAGFQLWGRLDGSGRLLPATAPGSKAVYRIWRRSPPP
ncbi:MAG: hypothetical protein ACKOBY_05180 [Cyanobium sp.]